MHRNKEPRTTTEDLVQPMYRWDRLPDPMGFPAGTSGKEPTCQFRCYKRFGFDP